MIKSAEKFVKLRLSTDPEEYRRSANETAEIEVWLEIINSFPDMRQWVAYNKTVSGQILDILAKDPDPIVRSTIARKRGVGEEILLLLANDCDAGVRRAVIFNPKISKKVLLKMLNDEIDEISELAMTKIIELK